MNKNKFSMKNIKKKSNKKSKLSKTKKSLKKIGGDIKSNNIFKYIKSIGFELETTGLIKLTITQDEEIQKPILVNSSLTNNDLEFGYEDPNEIIFLIDEKDEKFKITSDTNDDSKFNTNIMSIYENLSKQTVGSVNEEEYEYNEDNDEDEEEEDNCQNINVELIIPKFGKFDIKFKENIDTELTKCGAFTDTEFISTFYKPSQNKDIIKYYLFQTIKRIIDHLKQLKTYNYNKLIISNNITKETSVINIKQAYVLPNTTLVYFNPLKYIGNDYDINEDLIFVSQMTFCCNVLYAYRIMIQLLTIVKEDEYKLINIGKHEEVEEIQSDMNIIQNVMKLTNQIFENYQVRQNEEIYKFPLQNEDYKYFKTYMFLIFYKLYIYLNYYLTSKQLLFKYNFSFSIRHLNYDLYKEAEKYLRRIFSSNFAGKNEEYITQKIRSILSQMLDSNVINDYFYITDEIRNLHEELIKTRDNKNNFGRPEYTIMSYFDYFLTKKRDWLYDNHVDIKSTKFDLENNDVIVEFRDFPKFIFMELYLTGSQDIKNNLDFDFGGAAPSIPISVFKKYMIENGYYVT